MTARDKESVLLSRCLDAAGSDDFCAQNQDEANVFALAALVMKPDFPKESNRLHQAGERFFLANPESRLSIPKIIKAGLAPGLPRLHDMLSRQFRLHSSP